MIFQLLKKTLHLKRIFKILTIVFMTFLLTVLTQIGGILLLLSILISIKVKKKIHWSILFIVFYTSATFIFVPIIAPLFGRERVSEAINLKPTNFATIVLNRNYVRPSLNAILLHTAKQLKNKGIQLNYLDANFPFINRFPLLPHLSHNDGKKIDISLIYEDKMGNITTKQKSRLGYGVFVAPTAKEYNQITYCLEKGYFQYDYPKYFTFGKINDSLVFSIKGTKLLIQTLLNERQLGKLFIEPHLKQRMHLYNKKIRYHGCHAVRHDDHIHIQLK